MKIVFWQQNFSICGSLAVASCEYCIDEYTKNTPRTT